VLGSHSDADAYAYTDANTYAHSNANSDTNTYGGLSI
jgi:hypothetical protein